jgi:glycosyltransferase involved in cell wall biosynthesis
MSNKNSGNKSVLIVSNCTWYLYNFRSQLLNSLKKKGYNLILISPIDKYYIHISKFFINKENLFLVRGSENPILEIITLFHLFLIYLKYKPDLVHHFTIKPCIYGGIIARFLGIKSTINHITGLGPSFYSNRIKIKYTNKILKPFYKFAFNSDNNLINIFHNNSDRNTFINESITKSNKTKTIKGSGVDIKEYKNDISLKINKQINLLFPARIIKEKGIIELINACNDLWKDNYKFKLNIAGEIDKQNRSYLKNKYLQSINRNPNIIVLGKCKNMREVYKKMDIVILPSWREGLSKSLLEAAAMSLPIITTDVPGCKDIITNEYSGLLVPLRNKNELKSAIKKYLRNPELAKEFGKNARETVSKKFTVEIINNKILKIYEEFLNTYK